MNATLHDAYAADYDQQVEAYGCYVADVLFGLCYEYVQPGQRLLDAGIGSGLSAQHSLAPLKRQRCFVGDDLFMLWVVRKQ